jgi:hypothetical protein
LACTLPSPRMAAMAGAAGAGSLVSIVSSFSAACVVVGVQQQAHTAASRKVSWRIAMAFGELCFVSSMRWGWG